MQSDTPWRLAGRGAVGSGIIEMFYVGRGVCLGWKLRAPIVTDLMTGLARMAYLLWPEMSGRIEGP